MFNGTQRLSFEINDDVVKKAYWAALVILDRIISELETAIYRRASKHRSVRDTDTAIYSADYADPLALTRNALLVQRNDAAALCGVKNRRIHDISDWALGYVPWGNSYAVVNIGHGTVTPLDFVVGV